MAHTEILDRSCSMLQAGSRPYLAMSVSVSVIRDNSNTPYKISVNDHPLGISRQTTVKKAVSTFTGESTLTKEPIGSYLAGSLTVDDQKDEFVTATTSHLSTATTVEESLRSEASEGRPGVYTEGINSNMMNSEFSVPSKVITFSTMTDNLHYSDWSQSESLLPVYSSHSYIQILYESVSDPTEPTTQLSKSRMSSSKSLTALEPDSMWSETSTETDPENWRSPSLSEIDTQTATSENSQVSNSLATSPLSRESYDGTNSGANISTPLSKQGGELILGSVVGGALAFIGVFLLHNFIRRFLYREIRGQRIVAKEEWTHDYANPNRRKVPETSHFSIDSSSKGS